MTIAPSIRFGTAGWRGIIGRDFTFATVRQLAYALSQWWSRQEDWPRIVAVSYDSRFLSERFAEECAAVFARYGFEVHLTHRDTPHPAFSWYVRHENIPLGLNFTGSHNPPKFSGVKVVDAQGGVLGDGLSREIEEAYREHHAHRVLAFTYDETRIRYVDPREPYLEALLELLDTSCFQSPLRVVIDPLFGSTREYLDGVLSRFPHVELELLHSFKDPYFGGYAPEATGETVKDLLHVVRDGKFHIGIATDGDGDRFGIVDRGGFFISPDRMLAVFYHYLLTERKLTGGVVRNVATTHMLDRIAAAFGLPVRQTPIGFKNMAPYLWRSDVLMAAEESSGFAMRPHIPDKDGILAGLLACEIAARTGQSLRAYWRRLTREFGELHQAKSICTCDPDTIRRYERFLQSPPERLGGRPVIRNETLDGLKLYLSDETWVLIRRAGTEPVFRVYSESEDPKQAQTLVREILNRIQDRSG